MRLVYTRAASEGGVHRAHIAAMNADGSDLVQLTSGAFHDQHPDVSPDGQEIVFQSDREGDPNTGSSYVYVMNADGSGQSLLTPGPAYSPDWSPDGDRVAFIGPPDHWGGPIMVLAVDDGETRALTTLDPFATVDLGAASPTWSPDGTRLAFGRGELLGWGTHTSIWVMNADGTDETRLTEPRLWGGVSPVWSPDGSRLAFTDFEGPLETGTGRIKVMNADGTATVTVLQVQGAALWAVNDWSPDGEYLLFGRSAGKGSDLYLLRLADRTTLRLTVDGRYDGGARFWPSASPSAGGTR
jgi:TolB protein